MFRTIAILLILSSMIFRSYGLTSGPTQPEYSAFMPSNQNGMVDLFTGDFSYSIPVMTVPGPALSYPLTLGYRSGIQLEQEATTVGLGWSLNPGSINRNINRYPDDYVRGQSISTMRGDNVISGWEASVGLQYGGFGITANIGHRSDMGFRGGLDLNAGGSSINLTEYNQRDGFGTINYQSGSFGLRAFNMIYGQAMSIAAGYMGESMGMSMTPNGNGASISTSSGSFGFNSSSVNVGAFHSKSSGFSVSLYFVHAGYRKYSYWIANKEVNNLYGYLNLSEMPEEGGSGYVTKNHKMEYQFAPELTRKQMEGTDDLINFMGRQKAFAVSTIDGYVAHAEGYNASIKPYRQDVGDYFGMDRHEGNVPEWISWVDNSWFAGPIQWWLDDEKESRLQDLNKRCAESVKKFKNNNDPAYSDGGRYPVVQFREVGSQGGAYLGETFRQDMGTPNPSYRYALNFRSNSDVIYLPRWDAVNGKIVYVSSSDTRYVDDRISSSTGIYPKFREQYSSTVTPYIPEKALIGFTVVRPDGMIYEYHLPVFNYCMKVMARSKGQDEGHQRSYDELDFGDITSSNSMERAYAYSWLLTGVKTPDYIDLGNAGMDNSDFGSWVKFSYNQRDSIYHYRTPYKGLAPAGVAVDNQLTHGSYYDSYGQASWGAKEIYFLTDITTPTHHAKLTLSDRQDGKECTEITSADSFNILSDGTILDLEDVIPEPGDTVIFDYIQKKFDSSKNKIVPVKMSNNIRIVESIGNPLYATFAKNNGSMLRRAVKIAGIQTNGLECKGTRLTLKKNINNLNKLKKIDKIELYARTENGTDNLTVLQTVRFSYETDWHKQLCPRIPNSFDVNGNEGKLTLRKVEIGTGTDFLPAYQFSYYKEGLQAPYGNLKWDRWGYYKHDGGFVNTTLKNINIQNWKLLLDSLNSTNTGHLAHDILVEKLQIVAPQDVEFLTSNPADYQVSDIQKMKIVDALSLIVNDMNFYKDHKSDIDALLGDGRYYTYSQKWKSYVKSGDANSMLQTDGSPRVSPELIDWEKNAVSGFNLALVSELIYLNKQNRNSSVIDTERIIMKFLDLNRFDHNTDVNDVCAWSLKSIKLPSGAKIDIDLESDDYTYVGHVRAAEPVTAEAITKSPVNINNIGYYKQIGLEKDLISSNSMFKIKTGDNNNIEVLTQGGNKPYKEVNIRSSSLFRVYRNIGTAEKPFWQLNKQFEKIKDWQSDPSKKDDPRYKMHLIAIIDPTSYGSWIMNPDCISCGRQSGYNSSDGQDGYTLSYIPIDLGPINEPFKFFKITNNGTQLLDTVTNQIVSGDSACQRKYVDFTLGDLTENYKNWESKQIFSDPSHQCTITYSKSAFMQYGCGDPDHTINIPGANQNGHYMYQFVWGRKVDFEDTADVNREVPTAIGALKDEGGFAVPCLIDRIQNNNNSYSIKDAVLQGLLDMAYWDYVSKPEFPVRRGLLTWSYFQEYGWNLTYDYPVADEADKNDFPFELNYWDYYSITNAIKVDEPDLAANVAGVPGGGVRVKRMLFNNGWPQRTGRLPQNRVVEYQYVCDAGNGKPGNFSSGATPSVPPPFNNKGDDRNDQTPQTSLLSGSPSVTYGTIHEIRPGQGKIIHNYLTCADVTDFWTDDSSNYYFYNKQNKRYEPINGVYNIDPYPANDYVNPQHRWKLNKCSQFQGLLISENKYDQSGKQVSENKVKYQTSMNSQDICNLNILCRINDVNPRIDGILIPADKNNVLAGGPKYKLGYHPMSDYMGSAVERYRMKWICHQLEDGYTDISLRSEFAYIEVEAVEHSAHQYEVQNTTYGVGKRTINSYFDFLTGTPVVVTELEANNSGTSTGCASCGQVTEEEETFESSVSAKTTVTIPAYWVNSYNDTTGGKISMGPAINSNNNIALQLGSRTPDAANLKNKNMLSQTYSTSTYSRLLPPPCTSPACVKETQLNGKSRYQFTTDKLAQWAFKLRDERPDVTIDTNSLFSRTISTWDRFYATAVNSVWRKAKEVVLRAPMTSEKQIDHSVVSTSNIDYPWVDPATLSSAHYITGNENTQYDSYGHTVESKDANGAYMCNFYDSRSKGLYKSGTVLNARRSECSIRTFDESDALSLPAEWTTTGALTNASSRSGEQALQLAQNQYIELSLPAITKNNYVVSFWFKKGSDYSLNVNGTVVSAQSVSNSSDIWQKVFTRVAVSSSITVRIQAVNGAAAIDDIRVYPEDAQAVTLTYNIKGQMTSYAGADDNIAYFNYDALGRLTEIKDKDGMIVSTQSQYDAR